MNFSKFKRKAKGYECLGPSTVADATAFDNSCNLSLWMNTRFKAPVDHAFLARWQLRHTATLNYLRINLTNQFPNAEIDMEVPLQSVNLCGNTLFGTPDAIVKFSDGSIMIFDAKSGKKKLTHWIQIGLYGVMIQASARAKGNKIPKISGFGLCYGTCDENGNFQKNNVDFQIIRGENSLKEVLPEPTRARIREILSISGNEEMPSPKATYQNCLFCKWKNGCEYAVLKNSELVADASDLF